MKISNRGLTLVELLTVVFIIAILAAIAIPTYTSYITRARRADAKTGLGQVQAAQEMWRAEKGKYSSDQVELQNTMGAPNSTISKYYTWAFTATGDTAWTAQATPQGSQASDGWLAIDQNGVKTSQLPERWTK